MVVIAEVGPQRVSEDRQWHALEPDGARAREHYDVVPVLAEHAVGDPWQPCRLEAHGCLESSDVTGMHAKALPCGKLVGRDLP